MIHISDKQISDLLYEAQSYPDRDAYISDFALSSVWGDSPDADIPEERIDYLGCIWDAAHRTVRDIASISGLSHRKLAERLSIPYRTMENWCGNQRSCPLYLRIMMQEILGLFSR